MAENAHKNGVLEYPRCTPLFRRCLPAESLVRNGTRGGEGRGISKAHVRINQHLHCNTRLVIGMIAVGVANP